ncbi:MAG: hypothetical protein J6Y28_08945 [Acholeplasmatales bacterium]|nr:hypothetical protein [Acholeplasmatales bacterium]
MVELVTKEETNRIVLKLICDLSAKYSFYELSILLNVSEKTIYKWRNGLVPKANNYINLRQLHDAL